MALVAPAALVVTITLKVYTSFSLVFVSRKEEPETGFGSPLGGPLALVYYMLMKILSEGGINGTPDPVVL